MLSRGQFCSCIAGNRKGGGWLLRMHRMKGRCGQCLAAGLRGCTHEEKYRLPNSPMPGTTMPASSMPESISLTSTCGHSRHQLSCGRGKAAKLRMLS